LALLMRKPDDKRCMDVASEDWLPMRLRWAFNELMFELTPAMMILLKWTD
jgi:hypothetical protein